MAENFVRIRRGAHQPLRRTRSSFLRLSEKTQPTFLQLYHTVWTEKGQLVDCTVSDESTVTESYLTRCRDEGARNFFNVPDKRFNVGVLFAPGSSCASSFVMGAEASKRQKRDLQVHDQTASEHHSFQDSSRVKLQRKKRAWIVPGTVWCGSGNKATHYDDLGVFMQTDRCCREHDHCEETISAFRSGYGIFNRNFFTVSHCDCDHRFRKCLLGANDTIANLVGYSYFNILKTPCFIFDQKMQCTQTNWWGICTLSQMTQFAIMQDPTVYNSSHSATEDEESGVTSVPSATAGHSNVTSASAAPTVRPVQNVTSSTRKDSKPPSRRPKPGRRCRPRGPVRGETFRFGKVRGPRRRVCVEQPTASTQRPSTAPVLQLTTVSTAGREDTTSLPTQMGHPGSENALPTIQPRIQDMVPDNHLVPMEDSRQRDKLQPCDCYKHLDECRLKILPQEERFGLRNLEHKTLYHCNCTQRMAQQLSQLKEPDGVQSLLVDFVSLSCFKIPNPDECTGRTRCSAILSEASQLRLALTRTGDTGAGKQLEGPNPKVKRHNTKRSKRKHVPVRLYKRCLRIMDSKAAKLDKTSMS
ncbi:group 3 secretory phospholipase A2 [Megalops cyprinoides]|uniref:group 3 secretory phospholipase A2 n=1 Tax=Megalops cyprinoides TaxID=118141 RepID=UPI001864A86B|nr:group 3 secretory phospholipase A2 [Megalops cyprinoides]